MKPENFLHLKPYFLLIPLANNTLHTSSSLCFPRYKALKPQDISFNSLWKRIQNSQHSINFIFGKDKAYTFSITASGISILFPFSEEKKSVSRLQRIGNSLRLTSFSLFVRLKFSSRSKQEVHTSLGQKLSLVSVNKEGSTHHQDTERGKKKIRDWLQMKDDRVSLLI